MNLLLSFRNSGFSVDTSPTVWPQDTQGLERLCRYLLRCPVSISRIHWTPGSRTLFYESKGSHDDPLLSHPKGESLDIFEFIARVLTQIPESDIVTDGAGRAYLTGFTTSVDFPTTGDALQADFAGGGLCTAGGFIHICRDAFITTLSMGGEDILFSTYLGGSGRDDRGDSIALRQRVFRSHRGGRVIGRPATLYVAGSTHSADFPTVNAFQSTNAGDFDGFFLTLVQ